MEKPRGTGRKIDITLTYEDIVRLIQQHVAEWVSAPNPEKVHVTIMVKHKGVEQMAEGLTAKYVYLGQPR
jgi:hypothetical protein